MNSEEELELREYESRTQFLVERATAKKAETACLEGCTSLLKIQLLSFWPFKALNWGKNIHD